MADQSQETGSCPGSAPDAPEHFSKQPSPAALGFKAPLLLAYEPQKDKKPRVPASNCVRPALPAPTIPQQSPEHIEEIERRSIQEPKPCSELEQPTLRGVFIRARLRDLSMLLAGGAIGLAAAALLAFAAANWTSWSAQLRLAFFAGLAVAAYLPAAFLREASSKVRDASAALGTLLTTLFFVVVGQTWQSGAGAADLLLLTALLAIPWVIAVRRPLTFTLWFAALLSGLVFKGLELFDQRDLFAAMLPAGIGAAIVTLSLSAAARIRPEVLGLRAAAILPAAAFACIFGILPPTCFVIFPGRGLEALAGLESIYLAGAIIGAAALFWSRSAALKPFSALTLLGWLNALLILAGHTFAEKLTLPSLVYGLTLLNGAAFVALLSAQWFRSKRSQLKERPASADSGWTRLIPAAVAGAVGSAAILLCVSALLVFSNADALLSGGILAALGLMLGVKLRLQSCARANSTTVALFAFALLSTASGWLILSTQAHAYPLLQFGLPLAALFAACIFPWSAVLYFALLSPLATSLAIPRFEFSELLFGLSIAAFAASILTAKIEALKTLERIFSVTVAAALTASLFTLKVDHGTELCALSAAALIAAGVFGCVKCKSLLQGASIFGALLFSSLALWALNDLSGLTALAGLSTAGIVAFNLRGSRAKRTLCISLLAIALTAASRYFEPSNAAFVNVLIDAAAVFAAAAAAFGLAWVLLRTPELQNARFALPALALKPGAVVSLGIVIAAAAYLVSNQASIAQNGTPHRLLLVPTDPRDMLMGDFMELRYALDDQVDEFLKGRTAREPHKRITAFCVTEVKGELLLSGARTKNGDSCPKGTVWEPAAVSNQLKLPRRWFFPAGDAPRFADAVEAEVRCNGRNCVLSALFNHSGRAIELRP